MQKNEYPSFITAKLSPKALTLAESLREGRAEPVPGNADLSTHLTTEDLFELAELGEKSPLYQRGMTHIATCSLCKDQFEDAKRIQSVYREIIAEEEMDETRSSEALRRNRTPIREKWAGLLSLLLRPVPAVSLVTVLLFFPIFYFGISRFFSRTDRLATGTPTPQPTGPTDAARVAELEKRNRELLSLTKNQKNSLAQQEADVRRLTKERDAALIAARRPAKTAAPVTPDSADALWQRLYASAPLTLPNFSTLALLASGVRGETGAETPPLLPLQSPLGSAVLTSRPAFFWEKRQGAASYSISIQDDQTSEEADGATNLRSVKWMASKPLPPDRVYRWTVTAYDSAGKVIARSDPGVFMTLPTEQQAAAAAFIAKNAGQHFALAVFFAQNGVWGDALRELDRYAKSHPGSAPAEDLRRKVLAAQRRAVTANVQ